MPRKSWHKPRFSTEKDVERLTKRLIRTMRETIDVVYVKKVLLDPDEPRDELFGLLIDRKIYLGRHKHKITKTPLVNTLIHELIHLAFPFMHEETANNIEHELYDRLAAAEQKYLKRYLKILKKRIPKHEVKHEPPK